MDTTGGVAPQPNWRQARRGITAAPLLDRQGNAVLDIIDQVQAAQAPALVPTVETATASVMTRSSRMMRSDLGAPTPGGAGDLGSGSGSGADTNTPSGGGSAGVDYGTNLWLEIPAVTNNVAYVVLHNVVAGEVYELMSKLALNAPVWLPELALHTVTNQDWIGATVPLLNRNSALFFWARDWTGINENINSMPDWWEWDNFHDLNQTANGDYDGDGVSNLSEYQNGTDPNTVKFTVEATNNYVNVSVTTVPVAVTKGVPAYYAVVVDGTNFTDALWYAYTSSNIPVNLGTNEGWHEVWIGLSGRLDDSEQTWQWKRLKLDRTPPLLVITNPVSLLLAQPMIQLQGYCPEALSRLTCDLTNAAGVFSNQMILVLDRHFDTNTWEFTTATFQAFDLTLANGLNKITLRATDLAGNTTATNLNFSLDYSSKTNSPSVQIYWPQNDTQISGTNFTWRGWVDDFTASVKASLVDAGGTTNIVPALVERDGKFWVENLPVKAGTNTIQLIVTDAAGNVSLTNITVIKGNLNFAVTGYYGLQNPKQQFTSVYGDIGSINYTVFVNGAQAKLNNIGAWTADNVPVTPGGTSVFQARAIPNSIDINSFGASGSAASYASAGNPSVASGTDTELVADKRSSYWVDSYVFTDHDVQNSRVEAAASPSDAPYYWRIVDRTYNGNHTWQTDTEGREHEKANGHSDVSDYDFGPQVRDYETQADIYWALPPATCYRWDCSVGILTHTGYEDGIQVSHGTNWLDAISIIGEHCHFKTVYDYDKSWGSWWHYKVHRDSERNAQSEMKFFTGGKSVPGLQRLFVFSGSFTEILDRVVPPGSQSLMPKRAMSGVGVQIGGLGALGSNGLLYVNLPDSTTVDITPQSDVPYYYFSVGGGEVKVRIYDVNTGAEWTDKTIDLVVGQKVNLRTVVNSAGAPATAYQWNVPGFAISNYVATATSGIVYSNFPTANSNVTFYWVDGASNRVLTCSATVAGKPAVGMVKFNVLRPTSTLTSITATNSPPVNLWTDGNGIKYLRYGKPANVPGQEGIYMFFSITAPAIGTGTDGIIQIVDETTRRWKQDDGTALKNHGTNLLDNGFPASPVVWYINSISGGETKTNTSPDSPGQGLSDKKWFSGDDTFTSYWVYKPAGADSIWVALRELHWNWSGAASKDTNGVWTLDSGYPNPPVNPVGVESIMPPTWNGVIYGLPIVPDN